MEKMNFEKLIEKLEALGTGYSRMLKSWLYDTHMRDRDGRYSVIYGFIRGLAATNFITSDDEDVLIDLLFLLFYGECEQV